MDFSLLFLCSLRWLRFGLDHTEAYLGSLVAAVAPGEDSILSFCLALPCVWSTLSHPLLVPEASGCPSPEPLMVATGGMWL